MRYLLSTALVATLACGVAAVAQTAPSGHWAVTYTNGDGKAVEADLAIDGDAGTWRTYARGRQSTISNPCAARDMPVAVQASGDDLKLVVSGSKVVQGCEDFTLMLKRVDDRTYDGTFGSSRPVHLARK